MGSHRLFRLIEDYDLSMLLNTHSEFSLKYGLVSVEELFNETKRNGYPGFILTDINNTSACMEVLRMAPEHGSHVGIGIDFRNGVQQRYVGIARNLQGFRELNEHLSHHIQHDLAFPPKAPAFNNSFIIYPMECRPSALRENEYVGIRPEQLQQLALTEHAYPKKKLVVLQTSTFRHKHDYNAHRLLRAIGENCLLSQLPTEKQASDKNRFIPLDRLIKHFRSHPHIIENTERLFASSRVELVDKKNRNKAVWGKTKAEDYELMRQLAYEGLSYRYGDKPSSEITQRLEKELTMIRDLEFCSYFLINWDLVRYAQRKNYYHVGRGSGANSLVAYLMRITDVDPVELDLYFERFINPHREKPPDFDIDFSWTDRDDVTRYLFETHGYEKTALVGTYSTFKYRSVFRELGKVFGLPSDEIKRIQDNPSLARTDRYGDLVVRYAGHIAGLTNNLSVHASGILISDEPISTYTGTFMPPKGYATTQFDMQVAEDIGLHKFDILSQRGLGKIKDSISIIEENRGERIDIHDIAHFKQDPRIKQLLRVGDTIGCFYVESPAMRSLLTKLEADDYLRLVAASSIIRPGVAQSGMMREYILRYQDPERRKKARQELPELYDILEETYGVMVYQEDVIRVAHYFAGLTLAEADVLRRGMSWRFKQRNEFRTVEARFFSNCAEKGYDRELVKRVWEQIESFANFAFAKGHSASYAVESYQALYLKAHYPLEYIVATLNNGGGFYRAELYLHEARLNGGRVELPCVNRSSLEATIRGDTIQLGLVRIHGMEVANLIMLIEERETNGPFADLRDLIDRLPIALEQLCLLIRIGAFRFTGKDKKELLWDAHFLLGKTKKARSEANLFQVEAKDFELPPLWYHELEQAFDEMELLGFPMCDPFSLLKEEPPSKLVVADLWDHIGKEISIAGYLIHRKRTQTHSKMPMSFGTLLDLEGKWLDTVQFPNVDEHHPFRGPGCYLITGVVAVEFGFLTVETKRLERLPNKSMDAPTTRLRSTETYYSKPTTQLSSDHAERI